MNQNNCQNVNNYLTRFDEILCEMANKMLSQPTTNSITINFITCMIPHHEGAISMCNNLLKYCIDPRLKIVAENIISEQSRGVEQLKQIRMNLCKSNETGW